MRALATTPRQPSSLRLIDVDPPAVEPGRALVRPLSVGICGTDFELARGAIGEAPPGSHHLILGHESLGRVEAIGRGVTGFGPGDYVVATVRRPDGCLNCRAGESDMCLTGDFTERGIVRLHGYMTELYSEAPEWLVKVPPALVQANQIAVLLEPLSVVEKAVRQVYRIQERLLWQPQRGVVLGAGAIGLLATALLRLRGLETFTLARSPAGSSACSIIEVMGGAYLSAREHDPAALARELGQIDIIVEATGDSGVAAAAAGALGRNGVLCLLGVYSRDRRQEMALDQLYMDLVQGNRAIVGSVNANRSYFEAGIDDLLACEARWPGLLARVITRRLPLERFAEAFSRPPGDVKTVLQIASEA